MSVLCWNCGADCAARFCPACKALQPPSHDFFAALDSPRRLAIDGKELEKRFYALSRQLHPDLFSRKPIREQEYALEASAVLNDAFRTLKDPVARALYVLKQAGFEIAEQGTKDVPPELLEEVFELNMMLEELKGGDSEARGQLESARGNFTKMQSEVDHQLESLFVKHDAAEPGSGTAKQALQEIRGLLNRRRYIDNLLRDVDRALNPGVAEQVEDRL